MLDAGSVKKQQIMKTTINEINKKTSDSNILKCAGIAKEVIQKFYFIEDRIKESKYLLDLENIKNAYIAEKPMGSGGVGSIRFLKDKVYIQIGYGQGRHNYATVIEVLKTH